MLCYDGTFYESVPEVMRRGPWQGNRRGAGAGRGQLGLGDLDLVSPFEACKPRMVAANLGGAVADDSGERIRPKLQGSALVRAYRKRAKRYHPDHGGNAANFRELVEAKERVLEDWCSRA